MTALAAARRRFTRGTTTKGRVAAAASQNLYAGGLLGINAAGAAVPMSDATGIKFLGVLTKTYLATAAGDMVEFEYGHEEWFPTVSGTITAANVGFGAIAVDDSGITDAATGSFDHVVGKITQTETRLGTAGVWIEIRRGMEASAIPAAATADRSGPVVAETIPIGSVALGSLGTSAVHVAGSLYAVELYVPEAMRATGIAVLNGAIVGTDNLIAALYSSAGVVIANSALAGTLSAGANAFQTLAFTAALDIAPGRYLVVVQCNGTTATTRRIAASTFVRRASITAGAFGTMASITFPSGTTADAGPIAYVY